MTSCFIFLFSDVEIEVEEIVKVEEVIEIQELKSPSVCVFLYTLGILSLYM